MWINNIKLAIRSFRRNPFLATINVLGLSLGIACSTLIYLYINDELSYDKFNNKASRIHRAVLDLESQRGTTSYATSPAGLAPTVLNEATGVENTVRFYKQVNTMIKNDKDLYLEDGFYFADPTVFDIFTLALIKGDSKTALQDPFKIVLSESKSKAYFGDNDPLGAILTINDTLFEVSGIMKDLPQQSHLDVEIMASFKSWEILAPSIANAFAPQMYYTYFLLEDQTNPAEFEKVMNEIVANNVNFTSFVLKFKTQPLLDIHLYSEREAEIKVGGSKNSLYILGVIGIFIILIASINFINLNLAQSSVKTKEVGVRKVLGAARTQVSFQFLTQSVLQSLASLLFSLIIVGLALPFFNRLAGKFIEFSNLLTIYNIVIGIALIGIIGIVAGLYPAIIMSSLKTTSILKESIGVGRNKGSQVLRKFLVIIQFSASIFLIVGTGIVYKQLRFMQNKDLGFSPQQVLVLPLHKYGKGLQSVDALRSDLEGGAAVNNVSSSMTVPGRGAISWSYTAEGFGENERKGIKTFSTDRYFVRTYKMEILTGRDFNPQLETDLSDAVIINEAAAKSINWTAEEAIGREFNLRGTRKVIGVIKDFHYSSLKNQLDPMAFVPNPRPFSSGSSFYISVSINTADIQNAINQIRKSWNKVIPDRPFEYFFLNEDFEKQYLAEKQFGSLFMSFSVLAIMISCLGLFALASFTLKRKVKEIAIRKVLGSSIASIIKLFSWGFLKLVIIANLIAWPLAWFIMGEWVNDFAYKTEISWWLFLFAGFVAVLIAFITVAYQSLKAAVANPVDSLKDE